jgi:cytochrome c biogenesis protein CcdA
MKRPAGFSSGRLVRLLPVVSAFIIMCVGIAICYEALVQAGVNITALAGNLAARGDVAGVEGGDAPALASMGAFAVLGLGLVFGLKHATEVDHVVAVSTIVSEHRNIWRASLVGGLWGAGHTAALLVVGAVVLVLRVAIPEQVANWLEFGVALMIIGLGATALIRALRRRSDIHIHRHQHDGQTHVHVHFHEDESEHSAETPSHAHAIRRIGFKPFIVGTVHGLAGSAALTLLVLTQIESVMLGLIYLAVFGLGSIVGMLLMSGLVGLPFAFSSRKLTGVHYSLQAVAGVLSVSFGLWYAYDTAIASGLLRAFL